MASPLLLLLIGVLYTVVFGGLSLLRREGLSMRFALEAIAVIGLAVGLSMLSAVEVSPVFFLTVLYLVTMRVRLLVDVGNALARRGNHAAASRIYEMALRLGPDDAGRLMVRLNQGVLQLHMGQLDQAITTFRQVLSETGRGYLGAKHESGCHYNLGVAYQRKGQDAQATLEFNAVLETWPASEYARYAAIALERRRKSGSGER